MSLTLKAVVKNTALTLIAVNGKTSTLEVKQSLRTLFDEQTLAVNQKDVSNLMAELLNENPDWKRQNNGRYFEYSVETPTIIGLGTSATVVPMATVPASTVQAEIIQNGKVYATNSWIAYNRHNHSHDVVIVPTVTRNEARVLAAQILNTNAANINCRRIERKDKA